MKVLLNSDTLMCNLFGSEQITRDLNSTPWIIANFYTATNIDMDVGDDERQIFKVAYLALAVRCT